MSERRPTFDTERKPVPDRFPVLVRSAVNRPLVTSVGWYMAYNGREWGNVVTVEIGDDPETAERTERRVTHNLIKTMMRQGAVMLS